MAKRVDDTMRLFIAIHLSESMKNTLLDVQDALYAAGVRGNYTREENLHLTLAFIGDYPDAQPVLDALAKLTFTPFEICLDGMGCFGALWWVGLKGSAPLEALARRLRRTLAENGIPFDKKRFSPHITLIRQASGLPPGLPVPAARMSVCTISLMRSERGRNGMVYTGLGAIEAEQKT